MRNGKLLSDATRAMTNLIHTSVVAVALLLCHADNVTCRSALIVIDVQDCFLPGGALPVSNGDRVPPVINKIRDKFDKVIFSLDWHVPGHVSFASSHNKSPGDTVALKYLENGDLCLDGTVTAANFPAAVNCGSRKTKIVHQRLWPDHCIQNVTSGRTSSKLAASLTRGRDDIFVYKGIHKQIDSYSAFFDNGYFFGTHLNSTLRANHITKVFLAGFALDICVFYSSMDANKLGFETYTVVDASLGINAGHITAAEANMTNAGIHLIKTTDIPSILNGSEKTLVAGLMLALLMSVMVRTLVSL